MKARVEMGGSGFLAPAEAAALYSIVKKGYEVVGVGGTSGGGIVAALFAVLRDVYKLMQIIRTLNWPSMMDWSNYLVDGWNLHKVAGICDPTPLHNFLISEIGEITFGHLDFDLKLTATHLESQSLQVFSKATTPDVRVADAARATSSIPFIYPPMEINGQHYMDGGMVRNIPGTLFGEDGIKNICLYLEANRKAETYQDSIIQVLSVSINALMNGQEALDKQAALSQGTKLIPLPCGTLDAVNPHMTNTQRDWLMARAETAIREAT